MHLVLVSSDMKVVKKIHHVVLFVLVILQSNCATLMSISVNIRVILIKDKYLVNFWVTFQSKFKNFPRLL